MLQACPSRSQTSKRQEKTSLHLCCFRVDTQTRSSVSHLLALFQVFSLTMMRMKKEGSTLQGEAEAAEIGTPLLSKWEGAQALTRAMPLSTKTRWRGTQRWVEFTWNLGTAERVRIRSLFEPSTAASASIVFRPMTTTVHGSVTALESGTRSTSLATCGSRCRC